MSTRSSRNIGVPTGTSRTNARTTRSLMLSITSRRCPPYSRIDQRCALGRVVTSLPAAFMTSTNDSTAPLIRVANSARASVAHEKPQCAHVCTSLAGSLTEFMMAYTDQELLAVADFREPFGRDSIGQRPFVVANDFSDFDFVLAIERRSTECLCLQVLAHVLPCHEFGHGPEIRDRDASTGGVTNTGVADVARHRDDEFVHPVRPLAVRLLGVVGPKGPENAHDVGFCAHRSIVPNWETTTGAGSAFECILTK